MSGAISKVEADARSVFGTDAGERTSLPALGRHAVLERPATYWHMLPAYSQGRKAIWTAVNPHTGKRRIDEAFPPEIRANANEQEMFIRFKTGATWQVLGSDRYDAAIGSPPAGITFSEPSPNGS